MESKQHRLDVTTNCSQNGRRSVLQKVMIFLSYYTEFDMTAVVVVGLSLLIFVLFCFQNDICALVKHVFNNVQRCN